MKRPSSPQNHPDKGGDAVIFAAIQRAYDVLSDAEKRRRYDATGTYEKTVEEELLEDLAGARSRPRRRERGSNRVPRGRHRQDGGEQELTHRRVRGVDASEGEDAFFFSDAKLAKLTRPSRLARD